MRKGISAQEVIDDLIATNEMGDGSYNYSKDGPGCLLVDIYGSDDDPVKVTSQVRIWVELEAVR